MLGRSLIQQKKRTKISLIRRPKKMLKVEIKKKKKLIESNNELKRTFFFVIYHFPSQSSFHFDFKYWWSEISGNVKKKKKIENCNKIYFSNKTKNAKLISFLFFYSKEEKKVTQKNVSSFFFLLINGEFWKGKIWVLK